MIDTRPATIAQTPEKLTAYPRLWKGRKCLEKLALDGANQTRIHISTGPITKKKNELEFFYQKGQSNRGLRCFWR